MSSGTGSLKMQIEFGKPINQCENNGMSEVKLFAITNENKPFSNVSGI